LQLAKFKMSASPAAALPAWQQHPHVLAVLLTLMNVLLQIPLLLVALARGYFFPPPVAPKDYKVHSLFEMPHSLLHELRAISLQTILITGASSGIGKALAIEYSNSGVTVLLTGRNVARLSSVAADCRSRGAAVVVKALDVTDRHATQKWISEMDKQYQIDVAIANAGVSTNTVGAEPDDVATVTRALFSANVDGVFNTLLPLVEPMKLRNAGQLVVMSSQASFSPMNSYTYNANKAAVRFWAEGLRHDLAAWNIAVNVICPGFVRSPMTDSNSFYMPGLVEMNQAVEAMVSGLARNDPVITFPCVTFLASAFFGGLAPSLRHAIADSRIMSCLKTRRSTKQRFNVGSGGAE
jgi:short-subunit dehydrogenase